MKETRGKIVIHNGKPVKAEGYAPPVSTGFVYEVVRLMDGRFLFLEDHLERMLHSCCASGFVCPDPSLVRKSLQILTESEPFKEGNVKIIFSPAEETPRLDCYFIPHRYPSEKEYGDGVSLKTFRYTRPDPTIKRWNETFRKEVNRFIREEGIYEALLSDEEGCLTEGSRSNLFFVDAHDEVITAPASRVLPGITRKYILEYCREAGISVSQRCIGMHEAAKMRACFISGTSPMVLPVRRIDEMKFTVDNRTLKAIMQGWIPKPA